MLKELNVSEEYTLNDWQNHSFLSCNDLSQSIVPNVTNNKMNFDKQCQANKLSKMSIAIHFNLPHVCLSVPPFVFAVLFI